MTTIDRLLYWYTLVFSVSLIITALSSGFTVTNLTSVALLLPIPTFLLLQSLKRFYHMRNQQALEDFIQPEAIQPLSNFSFQSFLGQRRPLFLISIILLIISYVILLLKTL